MIRLISVSVAPRSASLDTLSATSHISRDDAGIIDTSKQHRNPRQIPMLHTGHQVSFPTTFANQSTGARNY